ncbi:NUDIX pyrophosphatase [Candidatus Sumerlaeota bacterium]|nr:NUDIX pyrophosphatase [Candidatus Sumerlaeota bacterium]
MSGKVNKIAVFVYRVNEHNQDILFLLLRRNKQLGGYWQPITGSVENNESLTQAARREILEETGLREVNLLSEPCYVFEFDKNGTSFREFVFGAQTREERIHLSSEHTAYMWVPFNEGVNYLYWDANKEGLRRLFEYLQSHPPS